MVIMYLGIETIGTEITKSNKVIAIGILMHHESKPKIFEAWRESEGERSIVVKFYELLRNILKRESTVWIIGFNIFRFDIPLLTLKDIQYGISNVLSSGIERTLKMKGKYYYH